MRACLGLEIKGSYSFGLPDETKLNNVMLRELVIDVW
jgi:hypothetical protein